MRIDDVHSGNATVAEVLLSEHEGTTVDIRNQFMGRQGLPVRHDAKSAWEGRLCSRER